MSTELNTVNVGVFNVLAAGMSNCGSFVGDKENVDKVFQKLVEISKEGMKHHLTYEKKMNEDDIPDILKNNIKIGQINKKRYCFKIVEQGTTEETFQSYIFNELKDIDKSIEEIKLTNIIKKAQEEVIQNVDKKYKKAEEAKDLKEMGKLEELIKNGGSFGNFLKELSEGLQLGLFGGFIMGHIDKTPTTKHILTNTIANDPKFQESYNKEKPEFILKQIQNFFTPDTGDTGDTGDILVCPEFDYLRGKRGRKKYRDNEKAPTDFNNKLEELVNSDSDIGYLPVGFYKKKFNTTPFTKFVGNKADFNSKANFYRLIFYNKKKYTITDLSISESDDGLITLLKDNAERMELLLVTNNGESKSPFLLFSCHLKSTTELKDYADDKEKEISNMKKIMDLIKGIELYNTMPIVIAGDFNFPLFESIKERGVKGDFYKTIQGFDNKKSAEKYKNEILTESQITEKAETNAWNSFHKFKKTTTAGESTETLENLKSIEKEKLTKENDGIKYIVEWMDFMKTLSVDTYSLEYYDTTGVCLKKRFTDEQGNDQVFTGKGEERAYNTDFIGLYDTKGIFLESIQKNKIKDISGRKNVKTTYCPYVELNSNEHTINLGKSWLSDHSIVMRTVPIPEPAILSVGKTTETSTSSSGGSRKKRRSKTKKKNSSRKKTKRKRSKRKSSKRSKSKKNKKKTTKK